MSRTLFAAFVFAWMASAFALVVAMGGTVAALYSGDTARIIVWSERVISAGVSWGLIHFVALILTGFFKADAEES